MNNKKILTIIRGEEFKLSLKEKIETTDIFYDQYLEAANMLDDIVAINDDEKRADWRRGVLILVCTAMAVCVHRKKLNIIQAVAVLALVVFLGIVFGSTVFTRTGTIRQYELVPFWSWRDIIRYHDWTLLKENLLNCILLLPAGILLPVIANHKIKWHQALLVGILVSAIIEFSQLIFMRGLFEWDDMIHNGLGCMMGCLFANFFANFFVKSKR